MRPITEIIVHCTATRAGIDWRAADIARWHKANGWKTIGYHFVVDLDGHIEDGRPISQVGAHCLSHNKTSIGICYVGGLDYRGRPADTRTPAQMVALYSLIRTLTEKYHCPTYGHRDFAKKDCPCFDAHEEYRHIYESFLARQRSEIEDVFGSSE